MLNAAPPMTFEYSGAPQKSPEWFAIRRGKITASRLSDWLATSKAKTSAGKPLKPRLDYEKELMFERQFNTSFEYYTNSAMQDGIDYEDYAAKQYAETLPEGWYPAEVGCWYSDVFVASPDRVIRNDRNAGKIMGLLEVKILKDNSFTEVLISGIPDKHWKQVQGQLFASKLPWCDYVALNFNTKKFVIVRVMPDPEFFEYLELALLEGLVTEGFALTNLHDIKGEIPEGVELGVRSDRSDSNLTGGW
jgi:hypothetical protein